MKSVDPLYRAKLAAEAYSKAQASSEKPPQDEGKEPEPK